MPRDLARARPKLVSSRYKPCRRAKHDDYATLLENFQSHHVYLFACFLLVGIGKGTADKIHEYLSTGKTCDQFVGVSHHVVVLTFSLRLFLFIQVSSKSSKRSV